MNFLELGGALRKNRFYLKHSELVECPNISNNVPVFIKHTSTRFITYMSYETHEDV